MIGVHDGSRDAAGARVLREGLPSVYRSDFWSADQRRQAVVKTVRK